MKKIIFIANAPFSSNKISIYQTLSQAQSIGKISDLTLLIPKRYDTRDINDFEYEASRKLNITKNKLNFKIRCIEYFDITRYKILSQKLIFTISNLSFSINALHKNFLEGSEFIYTRDVITMLVLSIKKLLRLLPDKRTIFESHQYSKLRNFFVNYIDFLVTINYFQASLYDHPNIITLHDAVWEKEIIKKDKSFIPKTILYSGSCTKEKGLYRLIYLADLLPEYKFKIACINSDINKLKNEFIKRNNIEFIGKLSRKKLYKLIDNVEYCILPNIPFQGDSNYTSPMKLFEYIARKKALILSPIPSVKEILSPNSYICLGSSKSDIRKAATKIKQVSSKVIRERSYKSIKNFTWEKRANKLLKFITKE